ncbi:LysR family transcriptional regulator [Cochlodiniinecator piscidefendens]|uniref:LysR family transcriptional regulator n=1 Tax=Cochlodiniinecator piscidefendens TaxID=2715756 RepID=UPI00140D0DB1|nr:LysR family transcriptional regulator [Cochlodiniinecator piscidefendens]
MKLLRNTLLETFVTVVECGGFSDAQFALGITQSAISIRIRDLETGLGYRVCERGRGGFRLTERGEIAYRKARDILLSARDFDAELLELRNAITGDLRIGVVDAVSSLPGLPLVAALQKFLARPNEVQLELVIASPTDLTQRLISGEVHVAIAPFRHQLPDLSYTEVCKEAHRLYCSDQHPLFNLPAEEIDAGILSSYPLCQRSYDMMASTDLAKSKAQVVVANMEAMAMLIESGHYLGALPKHFAQSWVDKGIFRELNSDDLRWTSTFYLASRQSKAHRRAVELFIQDICSCADKSDPK